MPLFCLGGIITIKHKGTGFLFLFVFLTPIIETQTPTWRQLEGQIIAHSLIDAFKLSSCQVSSVSISSQSLRVSLSINVLSVMWIPARLCDQGNAQELQPLSFQASVSTSKETGEQSHRVLTLGI